MRPRSRSGGWGRTAVAARPGPSSQLRRPQPPPPPSPRRSRRRHRRCRLPSASRSLLALLASLSPPLPPSRPLRSPHPASLPLPQPLLSSPHPASLPPPARSSQSRHQGGSRCSTMTGIAAASFFSNTCRFGGCGLHFPTLADLIEHIEDNHIGKWPGGGRGCPARGNSCLGENPRMARGGREGGRRRRGGEGVCEPGAWGWRDAEGRGAWGLEGGAGGGWGRGLAPRGAAGGLGDSEGRACRLRSGGSRGAPRRGRREEGPGGEEMRRRGRAPGEGAWGGGGGRAGAGQGRGVTWPGWSGRPEAPGAAEGGGGRALHAARRFRPGSSCQGSAAAAASGRWERGGGGGSTAAAIPLPPPAAAATASCQRRLLGVVRWEGAGAGGRGRRKGHSPSPPAGAGSPDRAGDTGLGTLGARPCPGLAWTPGRCGLRSRVRLRAAPSALRPSCPGGPCGCVRWRAIPRGALPGI